MRQIGTLSDEAEARRFEDYLLAQGVHSKIDPDDDGWSVWIVEEDQVETARAELDQFRESPGDAKYQAAATQAEKVRQDEEARQREFRKRQIDVRQRWSRPAWQQAPVTVLLIVGSVVVALLTRLGDQFEPVLTELTIASIIVRGDDFWANKWDGLIEVREGQVWRLVTPIFVHFGFMHILFNMYMLFQFGMLVERLRGSLRFGLLILLLAVASNLGQYFWSHPLFGGMSGVVYGLFGYCWMKSRFDPTAGILIDPTTVFILLGWFFLGVFHVIGHVANMAHAVGLGVGMAAGYAPVLWRKRRRM